MPLPCCSSSMAEVLRWGEDSFTLARPTRATVPPGMAVLPTARRPDTSAPMIWRTSLACAPLGVHLLSASTSWSSTAASLTARGTTGPAGQLVGGAATMGEATGGRCVPASPEQVDIQFMSRKTADPLGLCCAVLSLARKPEPDRLRTTIAIYDVARPTLAPRPGRELVARVRYRRKRERSAEFTSCV